MDETRITDHGHTKDPRRRWIAKHLPRRPGGSGSSRRAVAGRRGHGPAAETAGRVRELFQL